MMTRSALCRFQSSISQTVYVCGGPHKHPGGGEGFFLKFLPGFVNPPLSGTFHWAEKTGTGEWIIKRKILFQHFKMMASIITLCSGDVCPPHMCNWHEQHKRGPTFVFVSVFVYLLSTNTNTLFTFEGTLETIVLPNFHKFSENLQTAFDPPPALVSENYVALFHFGFLFVKI